jgi:DNA-binding beta-propeller fold protein YncE
MSPPDPPNRIAGGDMPLNLLEAEGRWILSTNSGWRNAYLQVYDEQKRTVSSRVQLPSLWYGLAYDSERKLVLASSADSSVYVFTLTAGRLEHRREMGLISCLLAAGVTLGPEGTAWVACNQNETVLRVDYLNGRTLSSAKVGAFPYAIARLPGGKLAVSLWGQSAIALVDSRTLAAIGVIPVGSHPNQMLYLPEAGHLLVACSDCDDISVVDPDRRREVRRFHLGIQGVSLGGAQPVSMTEGHASGTIYVALAATNAVAVLRVAH